MDKRQNRYTYVILKPDFLNNGLDKKFGSLLETAGLRIECQGSIIMDLAFIKELYQWEELFHSKEISDYLCLMDLPVLLIYGDDAVNKMLDIKKSLRNMCQSHPLFTLMHCPDSHDDFLREYKLINNKTGGIMKTNNQVEVIVFKKVGSDYLFLMLKRTSKKGGFWQPITGNVDPDESFQAATKRELFEETGIENPVRIFDTNYSFEFFDDGRNQTEKVFAAQVSTETPVTISSEHDEFIWANYNDCQKNYLKYPGNKKGLEALMFILKKEG